VRSIIGAQPADNKTVIVTDMEAGIEHLSRSTTRHSDVMLIVTEPYYRSLETASRIKTMSDELGIPNVYVAANKVRTEAEATALQRFCEQRDMRIIATIPYDEKVAESSLLPSAPLDYCPDAPGVAAVVALAQTLQDRY
jgi:CO dehydrogenase maturation factor